MIRQDGTIFFASELVGLIDRFLQEYGEVMGSPQSDLDRGLIIAYLLNVMCCDLELLGDCLKKQHVFGNLPPQRVLEECTDRDPDELAERREQIQQALHEVGWLPLEAR
jgi:hypothetical protein